MTSGVSQDDWREAEGCIGGSTSLPADTDQASRAAENRSPKGSAEIEHDPCKLRFAIYIYLFISYVRQNFDLRMRSFTLIARGNFRKLPVFYL